MGIRNSMKLLFLSLIAFTLFAQYPHSFDHLGKPIDNERLLYQSLLKHKKFSRYRTEVEDYFKEVDTAFEVGKRLDAERDSDEGEHEEELHFSYLKALRNLQGPRESLTKVYSQELKRAMQEKDTSYVTFLIARGRPLLDKNSKLKQDVLAYGEQVNLLQKNQTILALKTDKELDEYSYAFMQKMQDEYKAYQEVLKKAQAFKLRQLLVSKQKGGVIVYAQENRGDIDFYMENLFEMHVSSTLFIEDIKGYESTAILPYKLVLKGKQKLKVLSLKNIDKKKEVGYFRSHISWVKGSVKAEEQKEFIYALPFHNTQRVSQGFNGKTSHKGNARYAIDFAMDIGTPVYAARGGKVVEIVQRHNKHGMSVNMRQYANYIIIEHEDKTLGRYFHLKQNSVKVKLAQDIKKGQEIALSGNTGRTSGPHLHFVVTKAEEIRDTYRSMSIAIKFLCSEGVIDEPINGKSYCAVSK